MLEEFDKQFIKEYASQFSLNELYKHFGGKYSKKEIKNFCYNNKISYRKLTPEEKYQAILSGIKIRSLKQRQQTSINHNYFKTWSRNMAYIFGLWCADGYISRSSSNCYYFGITLHKDDKYLLELILKELQSEHKLYFKSDGTCELMISSKTIYNDIIALGGVERKSLILTFPRVPEEFLPDFIRGYFDGDGSIYRHYKKGGTVKFLGTYEFLVSLTEILSNNQVKCGKIYEHHPDRRVNHYAFLITENKSVINFYKFIYSNLQDGILYLKRKRDMFLHLYPELSTYHN